MIYLVLLPILIPIIGGLLIKPQGKPTLVPVTDKRQPMNVADVKNDFKMED